MSEINGNFRHWKVEGTSNILLLLLLAAILLNSLLVLGIQVWLVYDLDSPQEVLTEYPEYMLISSAERNHLQSWLLESPDGQLQMVTTEKHVFFDQYRIVNGGTREITAEPYTKTVWGDSALAHLLIRDHVFESYNETTLSLHIPKTGLHIPMALILYSILLIAIEICGYLLFSKLRGR